MLRLFLRPKGKSVGESEKLWEVLNKTKQEMREMQAKTNKQVAGEDTNVDDDSKGNSQIYINSTNERLERLENESQTLGDEIKNIQSVTRNLTDADIKVSEFCFILLLAKKGFTRS